LRFEVSALKFNGGLLSGTSTSFLLKNDSIVLNFDMLDEPKFSKLNYNPIRYNQTIKQNKTKQNKIIRV